MRIRGVEVSLFLALIVPVSLTGATPAAPPGLPAGVVEAKSEVTSVALPGAPAGGVALDYLAIDRGRNRVWVPAAGTGNVVVIDARTRKLDTIANLPTAEVERRGAKRVMGPSSVTVGGDFVYVGNRADSSVCAIEATSLQRRGCVTLPSMPDGVAFVAATREVWVTMPRDDSIVILDVSKPEAPALGGTIKLEGGPEGYAVDEGRGLFYTNLEDKDRTLRIDVSTRTVTANWASACGENGPRGLALEAKGPMLMVACTDQVEVLDANKDGVILSRIETGQGVDNFDYLPARRTLYIAAGGAATLTLAHLDEAGKLVRTASIPTAKGARNAVATDDGIAYVADGPEGRILIVTPAR